MTTLFQTIVDHVPPPEAIADGPLQLQVSALDYSSYVGVIGIGRIDRRRCAARRIVDQDTEIIVEAVELMHFK